MQNILNLVRTNAEKTQKVMKNKTNKYRKEVNYVINDKIFLSSKNIVIDRSTKKLKDKILDSFFITKRIKVFYELELLVIMRIYNMFYSSLLRKTSENSLLNQVQELFDKIIIEKDDKE